MSLLDRLPRFARLEFLGRRQAEGRLLAAGFLAGFALFLGWWAFQPPIGAKAGAASADARGAGTAPTIGDAGGVLDGITGAPVPGGAAIAEQDADPDAAFESSGELPIDETGIAPGESMEADATLGADAVEPGLAPPAEGAGADAMPMPGAPEAVVLRPFYVEVERGPGVSEVLRIDAMSPEQARAIVRDYRGDPRVLRGPSPQPLD